MRKVLFIQTAFIGDVVLATGLLETWHRAFPTDTIDIVVRKGNEWLFKHHPFINEVLVWHKQQNKYQQLLQLLKQIRHNNYHTVINVQRFAATGILAAFSKAQVIVGFNKNPFSFLFTHRIAHVISQQNQLTIHEVERNHALIQPFTQLPYSKPALYPSQQDYNSIEPYCHQPFICIAPSSVWFTKQFPLHKWVAFIKNIPTQYAIFLLGAKSDIQLCNKIITETGRNNITNLAGTLSFLQSAALQQQAVMNYVNDSAPMHFASAVNAPVTAVYCSTIPSFGFGPLSSCSYVVETTAQLACRPCGLHGKKACPLQHFNCANTITHQQLLAVLPNK